MEDRLAGRALLLFVSRVILLGMNFGAGVLVARGLGPTGRGVYAMAVLIPLLAAQTVSLGLNGAALYFTAQGHFPVRHVVSSLFWCALFAGGGAAVLAGWGLKQWGTVFLGEFSTSLLPLALGSLPFLMWADYMGHVLLGEERIWAFSSVGVIQSLVLLLSQTMAFLFARGRVDVVLAGWLLSQITAALVALKLAGQGARLGFCLDWVFLREAVGYSAARYVSMWLSFLNFRLDQFLVNIWVGSAALGQYAVAVSMTEALWQLPVSVGAVLFARVAAADEPDGSVSAPRICRLTLLAMIGLVIPTVVLARLILLFLFGSAYEGAVSALYALLPGAIAIVVPTVLNGYLYGRRKPHYVTYATAVAVLTTLVLDVLLIPTYGIVGAGLASSLAYLALAVVMLAIAHRVSEEPWHRFVIPSHSDWRTIWSVRVLFRQALSRSRGSDLA